MQASTGHIFASYPEVENISGLYFAKCKPARPASYAEDDDAAEKLWLESEKLVGLRMG